MLSAWCSPLKIGGVPPLAGRGYDVLWGNCYIIVILIYKASMENFILYSLSALFLVLALVVYFGKGDNLIAGYNTASEKERAQYNIKRLRLIIALLLLLSAVFVIVLLYFPYISIIATPIFVVVTLVGVVLANTWAKK